MTYGVHAGRISIEDVARVGALNTAKVFGLYPRKGALVPGADADVVIVDPDREAVVDDHFYHCLCETSVYGGYRFRGMARTTAGARPDGRVRDRRRSGLGALRVPRRRRGSEVMMRIGFGVNFMPTAPVLEVVEWARAVERHGYDLLGISDSQSIRPRRARDARPLATATTRIRLGSRVITPVTRHPAVAASAAATLAEMAPGRTMIGIGSGDSAAYNIGARPASLAELREYALAIRSLMTTGRAEYHGRTATLTWSRVRVPIYLAASGPRRCGSPARSPTAL